LIHFYKRRNLSNENEALKTHIARAQTQKEDNKMIGELVERLICVSEKAANIARACRDESSLFELLVEEKTGEDKNAKFLQDFKTLADVLIQETVRHDISKYFPEIEQNIFGEESNKFTNALGESIHVSVQSNESKTKDLLAKVLDGNLEAAKVLAKLVHSDIKIDDIAVEKPSDIANEGFDMKDVGIWIDPIDATSQYIKGGWQDVVEGEPPTKGLKVVTVLIGAFNLSSGEPCLGVVNQPFVTQGGRGAVHWGINLNEFKSSSLEVKENSRKRPRVLIGSSENEEIVSFLSNDCDVIKAGGAGHKLMMVALGLADVYINSGGSTFKWDTCAPHALLDTIGGGVKEFKPLLSGSSPGEGNVNVKYNLQHEGGIKANINGIIAYRREEHLDFIVNLLKNVAVI